jgi:hypothetical protein
MCIHFGCPTKKTELVGGLPWRGRPWPSSSSMAAMGARPETEGRGGGRRGGEGGRHGGCWWRGLDSWKFLCSVSLSVHEEESRKEEGKEKREKKKKKGRKKKENTKMGTFSKHGNF